MLACVRSALTHAGSGGRRNMATNGGFVHCAGDVPGRHRHICAFFNSVDNEHRVLRSFVKDGFL
jgi:hypothetical protein